MNRLPKLPSPNATGCELGSLWGASWGPVLGLGLLFQARKSVRPAGLFFQVRTSFRPGFPLAGSTPACSFKQAIFSFFAYFFSFLRFFFLRKSEKEKKGNSSKIVARPCFWTLSHSVAFFLSRTLCILGNVSPSMEPTVVLQHGARGVTTPATPRLFRILSVHPVSSSIIAVLSACKWMSLLLSSQRPLGWRFSVSAP